MSSCRLSFALIAVACTVGLSNTPLAGQQPTPGGTIERITVHGRSLEGNLEGDSPDRPVIVYLPPSYAKETARRYPVLYYLHGYTATAEAYAKVLALPASVDRALAAGVREMIVVLPDAFTKYSGSMYSNSPTIDDWETFIAQDLPAFIDQRYRTVASKEGRGLTGHSMGGYGTMRVGMKQPGALAALYAMRGALANALSAQAAAWAPNPKNPPEFFDLPTKDGEIQPLIAAKWPANSPLVMVDQTRARLEEHLGSR